MRYSELMKTLTSNNPAIDEKALDQKLSALVEKDNRKIVVLDDDPTGIQTVHGVKVYTDWELKTIEKAFVAEEKLFFILTNSRSFSAEQTKQAHRQVAKHLCAVSKKSAIPFLLISRGDSTLRGHYPLETHTLADTIFQKTGKSFDGEIICPYFKEGGRLTINNTHYLLEEDNLTEISKTEFAKDKTFGYTSSHLGHWIEEKTNGVFKQNKLIYITLQELRSMDLKAIEQKLLSCVGFNKIIVNAVEDVDLKVFAVALYAVLHQKTFLCRTAASFVRIIGGISKKPILTKKGLLNEKTAVNGLIIAGSHTKKTTQQINAIRFCKGLVMVEFNQHLVVQAPEIFKQEIIATAKHCKLLLSEGKIVCLSTKRERFDLNSNNPEDELKIAVKISDAIVEIVKNIDYQPDFIIAKGGITSSEIGTKALAVKEALVLGQAESGVPVWKCGAESRFPEMPYIIFPGNVGETNSLKNIVNRLIGEEES